MNHVTIDLATAEKLAAAAGRVELRDEAGNLCGYFSPANPRDQSSGAEPPITEEEMQRRLAEADGQKCYTTAEVLEHLKSLP